MKTARTSERGQGLIEMALVLPLLLMLVLNALNFGYFFLVALNLSSASRSANTYSIMGNATPIAQPIPPATPGSATPCTSYPNCWVSNTAYKDIKLPSADSSTIQVCSESVGVGKDAGGNPVACCSKGSGSSFTGGVQANGSCSTNPSFTDPEGPSFVLQQVDVWYTFAPLIPGKIFNIATPCGAGNCQFHRQALMRAMN